MIRLSPIFYYLGSGMFFLGGSAVLYNGWYYYTPRQQNKIVCVANTNVNLLCCLWVIQVRVISNKVQGIVLLACCISLGIFTRYDPRSSKKTFLVTYSALFLKLCPKVVKLMHIFNFCQLLAIVVDLIILPECNSEKLRYLFVVALAINWFVAIWGIILRKSIILPPFLYDPASFKKGYLTNIKVSYVYTFELRILLSPWGCNW